MLYVRINGIIFDDVQQGDDSASSRVLAKSMQNVDTLLPKGTWLWFYFPKDNATLLSRWCKGRVRLRISFRESLGTKYEFFPVMVTQWYEGRDDGMKGYRVRFEPWFALKPRGKFKVKDTSKLRIP